MTNGDQHLFHVLLIVCPQKDGTLDAYVLDSFGPPLLLSSMEVSQVSPPSHQDFFQRGLAWHIPHRH